MTTVLVTGGAGFFGGILVKRLLADGCTVVSVDLVPDELRHERLTSVRGDIRDRALMDDLGGRHEFSAVFHLAAVLAHGRPKRELLWTSNVDGTAVVADTADRHGIPAVVFTSSNCLWGHGFGRPVTEADAPAPVETYGLSKWEGEKLLLAPGRRFRPVVLRCPTIVDEGRLGLLAILFEFADEGRTLWLVGPGANRYQFIYAQDLADACVRAAASDAAGVYNVGSENVPTMKDLYQHLVDLGGGKGRVGHLPAGPAVAAMKVAHALRVSPLGPYQYRMITQSFEFDVARIKGALGWRPTLDNREMLGRAYRYYAANRVAIEGRTDVSDHRKASKMGVIKLLKWVS